MKYSNPNSRSILIGKHHLQAKYSLIWDEDSLCQDAWAYGSRPEITQGVVEAVWVKIYPYIFPTPFLFYQLELSHKLLFYCDT